MSAVSSADYWLILKRIDLNLRGNIRSKEDDLVVKGSELAHVTNREVPYNPLRIMREASRVALAAGVKGADRWAIGAEGASLCSWGDGINFFVERRTGIGESDADKLAALEVLALVCEHVKTLQQAAE
jgi:hypothetical protein